MANNQMSVNEYKEYFDKNNFQGDKYQTALFIKFLMDNKVKNNQIYDLIKVKKSQITNYKNIIKFKKIEDLKTNTFWSIIREIDKEKKRLKEQKDKEPEVKEPENKEKDKEPENKEKDKEPEVEEPENKEKDKEPEVEEKDKEPENEDQDLISDFEKMGVEDDGLTELLAEDARYAKPEYSPGWTSFKKPFGYSHNAPN